MLITGEVVPTLSMALGETLEKIKAVLIPLKNTTVFKWAKAFVCQAKEENKKRELVFSTLGFALVK